MKSGELIRRIAEHDPTGQIECCIGNLSIGYIGIEPASYDGLLQIIERDEDDRPLRGRRVRTGQKLVLEADSIRDLVDYSGFVVEYADETERQRYEKGDQERKRWKDRIDLEVDRQGFADWVFLKIQAIRPIPLGWVKRIEEAAFKFYDEKKHGPDNPVTRVATGKSYRDCRNEFWESRVAVDWDMYSRIVIEEIARPTLTNGLPNTEAGSEPKESSGGEREGRDEPTR